MIDKISTIKFLIEECHRNFPELADEIPVEEKVILVNQQLHTIIYMQQILGEA